MKANPLLVVISVMLIVALLIIFRVIPFRHFETPPQPPEKPTTNPPAIDSVTIDKLKACLKLTTTIPVDSHDMIVTPFVGDVIGLNMIHSPACKHKSHK